MVEWVEAIIEMKQVNRGKLESKMIRREWRLQQQRRKAHERRKEIMIKEYDIQREHRLKQSTGAPLLKEPEGTQINSTELRKIKVDVHRNIPGKSAADELKRNIVNPEDVVVKRRAGNVLPFIIPTNIIGPSTVNKNEINAEDHSGEGSKPIFKREEVTKAVSHTEEVEEHRTVAIVKDANLENKPQTSKKRSASLSMTRNRSYSHRRTSFRHSRYEDYKHNDKENRRSNGDRGRSRERKEDRQRTQSCYERNKKHLNKRSHRDPSRSRERDQTKLDRNSHYSKSTRRTSREGRMPPQQIPIPIYYGNFFPRPIMVGPLVPMRGHVAFRGSRYPMWPMRPFGPRFPPRIDMFRLRPPGNPRGFGPQY